MIRKVYFSKFARNLRILWPKPKKDKPPPLVRDIVKLYADKVMKESSTSEDIVVLNGYDSSAKDHCCLLRSQIRGLQIDLDWNTPVTTQQPVGKSVRLWGDDTDLMVIGHPTTSTSQPLAFNRHVHMQDSHIPSFNEDNSRLIHIVKDSCCTDDEADPSGSSV